MNKKLLSLMVIIMTIISVIFILYPYKNSNSVKESVQVRNTNEKSEDDNVSKVKEDNTNKLVENKLQNNNDIDVKQPEDSSDKLKELEDNQEVDDNNIEDIYNENKRLEEDEALTASMIYKVDKSSIESKLSVSSKAKLLYYASKLSNFDYAKIKNILDNGDEIEGAVDIIKILKSRLNKSDYEEMKKILSPYIDIDKIEEYISV